ncbi:TPA: lipopolysaccharide biosynthesis protein [Klebsiella pneumoniae]
MKKLAGAAMLSAGDILGKLIGFLILPYLTSKMGVSEYGLLTLYLSFIQILIILISFSGQGLLPVKYIQENENASLIFRHDNINLAVFSSIFILLVFVFFKFFLSINIPFSDAFFIVFASLVQGVNVINLSHLRISQTYKLASIGQFSLSVLNVLFTIVLFSFLDGTAEYRLMAVTLSFLLVQLFYSYSIFSKLNVDYSKRRTSKRQSYKEIMLYGISLWPHHGSYWIKSTIDRFFIAHYMSVAVVGVYGLALQLSSILMLFFSVISQAFQPFIYRYLNEKDFLSVKRIQFIYVCFVLFCALVYYIVTPYAFPYLFSHKFNKAILYFNYLLPGTAFMCIYYIYTHVLFFYKRNKIISTITASSMLIHLIGILCVILIHISVEMFCVVYTVSSAFACIATACVCSKNIKAMRRSVNDS